MRDLSDWLENAGTSVRYAIHPFAVLIPGHMNVLLAEANVRYDELYEVEGISDDFERTDVSVVVRANDVVDAAS